MIVVQCACGWQWSRPETAPKTTRTCDRCGRNLTLACAEPLPPGAGAGDFDAYLEILSGPERVGERLHLGGVADIPLGRLDANPIHLSGHKVSRQHGRLARVDFGPSRWSVADNDSAHGLFINDHRITFRELRDGDVLRVGDYELRYGHADPAAPPAAATEAAGPAVRCPSCHRDLPAAAKACVPCGVRVPSGRPLLVRARDYKQELEDGHAAPWLPALTWIVWLTPVPIPLLSEAPGQRQPWAVRLIAAVTVITSVCFLLVSLSSHKILDVPGKNFMLWPPGITAESFRVKLSAAETRRILERLDPDQLAEFQAERNRLRGTVPDDQLDRRTLEHLADTYFAPLLGEPGQFRPYQFVTHAFLHSKSSIMSFAGHLGVNLVFLFVFGSRINAVIGSLATFLVYPILAIGSSWFHLHFGHPDAPLLGASGAINGLAGMYLVLFPLHRVYCGMWVRFRLWCVLRVFAVRGFWVLLLYVALDTVSVLYQARFGSTSGGGTAHLAHIGGFLLGVAFGFAVLLSRRFNCGGGDVLSVMLGRYAWPLIGRPTRWHKSPTA